MVATVVIGISQLQEILFYLLLLQHENMTSLPLLIIRLNTCEIMGVVLGVI